MDKDGDVRPVKACRYCGEEILAVAIKCKHCGSSLPGEPSRSAKVARTYSDQPARVQSVYGRAKREPLPTGLRIALGAIVGIVVIWILRIETRKPQTVKDMQDQLQAQWAREAAATLAATTFEVTGPAAAGVRMSGWSLEAGKYRVRVDYLGTVSVSSLTYEQYDATNVKLDSGSVLCPEISPGQSASCEVGGIGLADRTRRVVVDVR